jgi:hypothetical protein
MAKTILFEDIFCISGDEMEKEESQNSIDASSPRLNDDQISLKT